MILSKKLLLSINYCFSSFKVLDVKNSHLVYVKDSQASLPYLSEITTESGQKGVVIKLGENAITVIGMYSAITNAQELAISNVKTLHQNNDAFTLAHNQIYNINLDSIAKVEQVEPNVSFQSQLAKEARRLRLRTISPLMSVGYDLRVGDFIGFSGPMGSGRTTNAIKTLECFTNSDIESPFGIYLNTNAKDYKTALKAASLYRTSSFARDLNSQPLTSVGVYMLTLKCLKAAIKLKQQGKNVMLVIDNFHEILANEWTVLQSIKLPIAPVSLLGELYAHSTDNGLSNKKSGSLTSIVINSPDEQDVLQEFTTFGNNSRHLKTICTQIEHPIQLRTNNSKHSQSVYQAMREKINRLMKEKRETELLTQLKLNKEDPWEQYFILDSQWWAPALKKYRPQSIKDLELFLWFVNANIEEEFCAHWRIDCLEAYHKYLDFLAHPVNLRQGMKLSQLESFIEIAKMQQLFDIYKKDYLL